MSKLGSATEEPQTLKAGNLLVKVLQNFKQVFTL